MMVFECFQQVSDVGSNSNSIGFQSISHQISNFDHVSNLRLFVFVVRLLLAAGDWAYYLSAEMKTEQISSAEEVSKRSARRCKNETNWQKRIEAKC